MEEKRIFARLTLIILRFERCVPECKVYALYAYVASVGKKVFSEVLLQRRERVGGILRDSSSSELK